MKRRLLILAIFLLLGAVVNVAVAWGFAFFVLLWDIVGGSQLRAYTPDELDRLAADVSTEYAWACGKVAVGALPARLTYLIGHPRTTLPSSVE